MTETSVRLEPAADGALSYVEERLAANDLPTEDVRPKPECFHVAYEGGQRVGIGGVERYGTDGLLRSVVVEESARGSGVGTALCDALETAASEDSVETLYLLTTTAAGFFADRGYEETEREDAPASIRGTAEFEDLCADSATCMATSLTEASPGIDRPDSSSGSGPAD